MTATECLRVLLDERGVKWWPLGSDMTECVVDGVRIKYRQVGRGLIVSTCTEGTVTPEQAIAATLGDVDLAAENAKLRERVDNLFNAVFAKNNELIHWLCENEKLCNQLRELGVEVSE